LVVYIIVSVMHGQANIKVTILVVFIDTVKTKKQTVGSSHGSDG